MVLCHFLESNRDKYNLADKNVIELGAGTGLVTIVSSLLGTGTKQSGFGSLNLFFSLFDFIFRFFLSLLLFGSHSL